MPPTLAERIEGHASAAAHPGCRGRVPAAAAKLASGKLLRTLPAGKGVDGLGYSPIGR
jgi:hypothetical protein